MHLLLCLGAGAVQALCMREDIATGVYYASEEFGETSAALGCCEVASRNTAGTTTSAECDKVSGRTQTAPSVTRSQVGSKPRRV